MIPDVLGNNSSGWRIWSFGWLSAVWALAVGATVKPMNPGFTLCPVGISGGLQKSMPGGRIRVRSHSRVFGRSAKGD